MRGRSCGWLVAWMGIGLLVAAAAQAVPSGADLPELPSRARFAAWSSAPLAFAFGMDAPPPGLALAQRLTPGGVLVGIGLRIGLFSDLDPTSGPPTLRDLFAAVREALPLHSRARLLLGGPVPRAPEDTGIPAVPEPSSALLLLLGLGSLAIAGRRRA